MDDNRANTGERELFRHPLIRQLGQLIAELVGIRILVVHPTASGWAQNYGDERPDLQPDFCKLFQGSPEGAKHCRMCHILMSVAACSGGPVLQRCHAGACVVVCPAAETSADAVAIMSSCTFASPQAWGETSARGKSLGIDMAKLREAFLHLPKITERQHQLLDAAMKAMSQAIQVIKRNSDIEARLHNLEGGSVPATDLARLLKNPEWAQGTVRKLAAADHGRAPMLVGVVCELVRQRPELPLTVKELAAAARVTPNHLTTLFGQWTGQSFTEHLATQRMARAKELLDDLTLNINEIARLVGYDDPGYFARRFRQKTGLSPREWRQRTPQQRTARKRTPAPSDAPAPDEPPAHKSKPAPK